MTKGDSVTVNSVKIKGNDDKIYNILCFFEAGRGWSNKTYYASKSPVSFTGTVITITDKSVSIKIDPKYLNSISLIDFSKKPYVSKVTGKSDHIRGWFNYKKLKNIYGVLDGVVELPKRFIKK